MSVTNYINKPRKKRSAYEEAEWQRIQGLIRGAGGWIWKRLPDINDIKWWTHHGWAGVEFYGCRLVGKQWKLTLCWGWSRGHIDECRGKADIRLWSRGKGGNVDSILWDIRAGEVTTGFDIIGMAAGIKYARND